MNFTKEQWQKILSILLSAAIAIAAVLGWQIGVQPLLFPTGGVVIGSQALRERIALDTPTDSWIWNGAKILMYSDNHATEKVRLEGAVGDLTLARTLTVTNAVYIGANAFTGPVRMISATVSNDTFVAHGFSGVQPKILCTPFAAGLFTYTVWISATNAVSFSVGLGDQVTNGPGVGSWVVNCIAQP